MTRQVIDEMVDKVQLGKRNIATLYAFTATSRLWFDGGLWLIYFQHRGISLFEIGLLEALLHVVAVVSDVPIGAFADRFGWKISLGLGTVLGVAYTVIALLATNPWLIAVAFAARGLQMTLTNGSDSSLAYESASWAGVAENYRAISGRMLAVTLVSLGVAEAIGGVMASHSWSMVYVAFTAANVASFFTVLWLKEPRDARLKTDQMGPQLEQLAHPSVLTILREAFKFARRSPEFVKWIVFSGTLYGITATFSFYGQALFLHAGWTLVTIGVLMGVENFIGAWIATLANPMTIRIGEHRMVHLIGIVASAGLLIFAWVPGIMAGLGYLLDSMAGNLAEPVIDAGLNQLVPSRQRATLLSANSTAFSLFMIVGFPLFGALASSIGLEHTARLVSFVGVFFILGTVVWWSREARSL